MDRRCCIIGAGAVGMAAMQALISAGIEFDCFEATERVGGNWHTDYDCLHLITPREGSGFRGDPMPQSWADFPRRSQMLEYLERFADRNHLRDRVTFGTRVDRLDPIGANAIGGWNVSTSDGRTRTYAEPEGRIDIVRSIWNDQMAATRKRLGELARLSPPAAGPAAAGPAAAGPSKSAPFAAQR